MSKVYINTSECQEIAQRLNAISGTISSIAANVGATMMKVRGVTGLVPSATSTGIISKASKKLKKASECIYESVNVYSDVNKTLSKVDWTAHYEITQELKNVNISASMTDDEKRKRDEFLRIYETICGDEAIAINCFFAHSSKEGLTEDDIANIKYLAYNSPLPYHYIFFECIGDCVVLTWQYKGTSFYGKNEDDSQYGVHLNLTDARYKDGAYRVVFHELGHQIDDLMMDGNVEYTNNEKSGMILYTKMTDSVKSYQGIRGLQDVLYSDLKSYLTEYVNAANANLGNFKLNDESKAKVIDALLDGRKKWTTLNPYERTIYELAQGVFETLPDLMNYGVSDVVGGLTNNTVAGNQGSYGVNIGHSRIGSSGKPYWYDDNGNPTLNQGAEFFAHCMEYAMTGQTEKYESLRAVFPNAVNQVETQIYLGRNKFNNENIEQIMDRMIELQPKLRNRSGEVQS